MSAVPIPRRSPSQTEATKSTKVASATPVLVLKELVANLQKEQNQIQELLSALGYALRSFNNPNQFFQIVPLMLARITDAKGGALILYKHDDRLSLEQLHCQDARLKEKLGLEKIIREINERMRQQTPEEKKAFSLAKILDDRIQDNIGDTSKIFSTSVVLKGTEKGRLYVFSDDTEYSWNLTKKKSAQLVADLIAVSLINQDLAIKLQAKERQDRILETASEIQLHLFPRHCPLIQGLDLAAHCKTAEQVGGDYYDFIPTDYDRLSPDNHSEASSNPWSITIGDVMGKGVPAGLLMTMTRGMLRAEVLNRHSPAQILKHLNRVMYADLDNSGRFVSLFYSEYDPLSRILSYTNAAHNPPLLWQAKTRSLTNLDVVGDLLGLSLESDYEDKQIQLESGDIVVYYTDGFTEAINQSNQLFGEERLEKAFQWACENCATSQEILTNLFEEVRKFIGFRKTNNDDMTAIVLRVE
jgi:sigma-B regulation protein RsbU (phosphoserine phosphatase)